MATSDLRNRSSPSLVADAPSSSTTPLLSLTHLPAPTASGLSDLPAKKPKKHWKTLGDYLVPPFIMSYMLASNWTSYAYIAKPYLWDYLGRRNLALIQIGYGNLVIGLMFYTYLSIYLLPSTHSSPPSFSPPQAVLDKTVLFECDENGEWKKCWKDECGGRWKGARVRHCSICRTCRVGYDHHCPWFGTCITLPTHPSFLLFVLLTPLAVLPLSAPILPALTTHTKRIWAFSRDPSGPVWSMWWSWGWSWVLGVGPVGRMAIGLILGFYWPGEGREGRGHKWESGWLVLVVLIGWGVSLIAVALATTSLYDIYSSATPIESRLISSEKRRRSSRLTPQPSLTERLVSAPPSDPTLPSALANKPPQNMDADHPPASSKPTLDSRTYFFIPSGNSDGKGVVLRTRFGEKPYDLGGWENLKRFWSRANFWRWSEFGKATMEDVLPSMNPNVLGRLKYEAESLDDDDRGGGVDSEPEEEEDD